MYGKSGPSRKLLRKDRSILVGFRPYNLYFLTSMAVNPWILPAISFGSASWSPSHSYLAYIGTVRLGQYRCGKRICVSDCGGLSFSTTGCKSSQSFRPSKSLTLLPEYQISTAFRSRTPSAARRWRNALTFFRCRRIHLTYGIRRSMRSLVNTELAQSVSRSADAVIESSDWICGFCCSKGS